MKLPDAFSIQPRLFALLALSFILATILGTVSHEMGHYVPAKAYGYKPELHYQMVSYGENPEIENIEKYYEQHRAKITVPEESTEKNTFHNLLKENRFKGFIMTLGGPLQTMLTGTIGFLILWFNRKKIRLAETMSLGNWILVLLAFFWSRQLANMVLWTGNYILTGKVSYRGDEIKMSRYIFSLERDSSFLVLSSVGFLTGIIAAAILTYTVFYIIPRQQRLTFLCAGTIGSILGWIIWMKTMGPALLP